ncbi:5'-3' exoribonuclease 2 [Apostasia shenzhenica]|uniref:5'-3' exoribonuclease 2 n=1 Tax=Apostasia shenzhenica TaxID=1088818 RepID=A0A2I0B4W8_9ASPA|nr:5'-3' exoribonuclease 2 [Apostasia shenzhenica]
MIHKITSNCWFSLIINGIQADFFKSIRGFRQGDAICHTLFIIAAEYLSRGLNNLINNYTSISYHFQSPIRVSHLAFADDCIIFCNGTKNSLQKIKNFLNHYESISGQKINVSKSSFICSKKTGKILINNISNITGFNRKYLPISYLGCPIYKGNIKIFFFNNVINKIRNRIFGWEFKLLSKGAKIILINFVLSFIPQYLFHNIPPTKGIIKQLDIIFTKFL